MKDLNKKNIFFFLFIIIIVVTSCRLSKAIQPNEESLRIRIAEFYSCLKTENYEKLLDFSSREPVKDKKNAAKYLKDNFRFKIISFKSDSITRQGEFNAKVKMIITYMLDKEFKNEHVDCWIFKNGNWYIDDFARTTDWECKLK